MEATCLITYRPARRLSGPFNRSGDVCPCHCHSCSSCHPPWWFGPPRQSHVNRSGHRLFFASGVEKHFGKRVSGRKRQRACGNRGSPAWAGSSIALLNENGERLRAATTFGDGTYIFRDIEDGSYTVQETDPDGFTTIAPNTQRHSRLHHGIGCGHRRLRGPRRGRRYRYRV